MMPIGMSRLGLRASCAAVETASKPMYAKKICPAPAKRAELAGVLRQERMVVVVVDEEVADSDKEHDHCHLHDHDKVVELRRFANAADENGGNDAKNQDGNQIDFAGHGIKW